MAGKRKKKKSAKKKEVKKTALKQEKSNQKPTEKIPKKKVEEKETFSPKEKKEKDSVKSKLPNLEKIKNSDKKDKIVAVVVGTIGIAAVLFISLVWIPSVYDKTETAKQDRLEKEQNEERNSEPLETRTTEEGLIIEELTIGTGKEVEKGDVAKIHYIGKFEDGTQFETSYQRGEPLETQIGVGGLIKGWDEGVPGMLEGGRRRLTIPPELGYGEEGKGNIPGNSTLVFEIELVEVVETE